MLIWWSSSNKFLRVQLLFGGIPLQCENWLVIPPPPPPSAPIYFVKVSYEPSVHIFLKLSVFLFNLVATIGSQHNLLSICRQACSCCCIGWNPWLVQIGSTILLTYLLVHRMAHDPEWNWTMAGAFCREQPWLCDRDWKSWRGLVSVLLPFESK